VNDSVRALRAAALVWAPVLLCLSAPAADAQSKLAVDQPLVIDASKAVNAVAFSPDGTLLLTGGDGGSLTLWDPQAGKSVRDLTGHTKAVKGAAFSPDGKWAASGDAGGTLRVWAVDSGKWIMEQQARAAVNAVAFSADGQTLAVAVDDGTVMLVSAKAWQGEKVNSRVLKDATEGVTCVAFSPDGATLAGASATVDARDVETSHVYLWDLAKGALKYPKTETPGFVRSLSYSADGKSLAAAPGGRVVLFDPATGKLSKKLDFVNGGIASVAFTPDGNALGGLACGGNMVVQLWTVDKGKGEVAFQLEQPKGRATAVAFSADGRFLAGGCDDGKVLIWKLRRFD
jgi:WD40 repeat protein